MFPHLSHAHKEVTNQGSTGNHDTTFSCGPARDPNPRLKRLLSLDSISSIICMQLLG